MSLRRFGPSMVAAVAVLAWLAPSPAHAQYFGRNKVQYQSFHFKVLATDHFDLYYYEDERPMAEEAGRMAERWYERLSKAFNHELHGRQPLILYASHPHFEQTNAIPGELDESTGGVTESYKRRIVLPLGASLAEVDHVIGHELTHAFQYDLQRRGESGMSNPGTQMPLWFVEGMAEYLSIGPHDANTAMWMRDAARNDKLPTIAKLDQSRFFPYRYGEALWAFVASRYGEERVGEIFKAATGRGTTVDRAFEAVLGFSADSLSREWQRATKAWATGRDTSAVAGETTPPPPSGAVGRLLLGPTGERGRLNVSPSLSPDGSKVAFLSERGAFSIELFVADAATGKIERRLTKAAVDPHLQSLQFINSAGEWSPDGSRIAVATVRGGEPAIEVMEARSGSVLESIRFPELGEVYHPTWSPDAKQIAFSGLIRGASDLFVVDLATRHHRRLTDDLYSDLQPAWSPDGRSIAFASDRFTTQLADLRYGPLQLVRMDLATSAVSVVPGADVGKNINPQWSGDGQSLFFVSDRSGISNLYRVTLDRGQVTQVTDVPTGVSGITALSPAFSVARRSDRAVFSVYEKSGYRIHELDGGALSGTAPGVPLRRADLLPSALGDASATATAAATLPDSTGFQHSRYHAGLSLDSVGQIAVGVSAGNGGYGVGGGSALFWSDMLGDHNLATQFQVSSSQGGISRNLAALVSYVNLKQRWNWSVSAGQIPYFWRDFQIQDTPTQEIQTDSRFWEIQRQVQGLIAYPFNRAQRVEFGVGYESIDFQSEVETQTIDVNTGSVTDVTVPGPDNNTPTLNLIEGLAALAYDTSVFGGTSPVLGQRYRVEASPVVGDLHYVGVLGDYRRYVKLGGPFTLAGRGLHLGRYGKDSDTQRISPLFLGYPWLVRGYDASSFTVDECNGGSGSDCPVFDQLFGSRLAVANLELRMPLFGALGVVPSPMVPPVEVAAFYDAGVAWTGGDKARFLGGARPGVSSYGGAFRLNLLGFAVAEISYVHPNDRPVKGAYWVFALQPGF